MSAFFALWGRPVALKDIKVGPVGQKNVPLWLRTSHMGNCCSEAVFGGWAESGLESLKKLMLK